MSAQQRNPYLLLTMTMMLWGGAFSSSETVVNHVPHTVAATLRFGGGAIALLIAMALTGRSLRVGMRAAGRACLAGVLGVFAYNGFFFWGLSLAPSLDGGILIPVMSPVLTSAFLLVTGREKASPRRLAGLALGLAGAAVYLVGANSAGGSGGGSHRLEGDLLYVLSAVSWAAFTLAAPKVLAGIEPLTAMAYATCTGAVLLALVAAPDLGRVQWGALPSEVWLNVAYLAIGATAVANVLYYRGVAVVGPANASLMMFLVPAVNTTCATLLLDESFTALQAAGAVVLLVGAALAGRARISLRRRRPTRGPDPRPQADTPSRLKLTPRPAPAGYPKDHE
ncbi:drug/metabolite transporter (DMT)-like permease [Catenulispora sp. EB89]|uniref:DMT family transporter n=1 Tax=Catenulispora sp. EB89 TaxID=3156257 RepID=UPI0035174BFD